MKLKKVLMLVIISIILISIPAETLAWTTREPVTYEVCNIINICISGTLKIVAFAIAIIYAIGLSKYIKSSKDEPKQKVKNIEISLIIAIIEIIILLFGASWVTQIGMETFTYGETYTLFDINSLIANSIRIIAFVSIFFYIIKSIIYFISTEQTSKQKVANLIKWEIITAVVVIALLILPNYL